MNITKLNDLTERQREIFDIFEKHYKKYDEEIKTGQIPFDPQALFIMANVTIIWNAILQGKSKVYFSNLFLVALSETKEILNEAGISSQMFYTDSILSFQI